MLTEVPIAVSHAM